MAASTIVSPPDRARRRGPHDAVIGLAGATVLGLVIGWALRLANGGGGALTGLGFLWSVLLVLIGFVLYRPWAAALLRDEPAPSVRAYLRRHLLSTVPLWWVGVIATILFAPSIDDTLPTDAFSPVPAGETAVPFATVLRHLTFTQIYTIRRFTSPMPQGWIIATGVAFLVLVPILARLLGRGGVRERRHRLRRQHLTIAAAIGIAWIYRIVLIVGAGDRAGSVGPRTWLPNHLDLFALGMLLAVSTIEIEDDGPGAGLGRRIRRSLENIGGPVAPIVGLVLLLAVGAGWGPTADQPFPPAAAELARSLVLFVAAALITAPILLGWSDRRPLDRMLSSRPLIGLGHLAYGSLIWFAFIASRWVSAPGLDGAPARPARHPGQLFSVSPTRTILFVVTGTLLLAAIGRLIVQRPAERRIDRRFGTFAGGLWTISIASFLTRIWGMGAVTSSNPGNGDPFFYHAQANMLADRVGFAEPIQWLTEGRFVPTAIHPPIYTLWLTPSSILGARGFLPHKTMGAIAGVLVVVVTALLVRHLIGDRGGLIAGILVALYPNLWLIDGTLWPEGLYTATIALALLLAYRWRDRPSLGSAAALGAACGIAILTRGEALLLLPLLCLPLAFSARKNLDHWFRHLLVMGLAAGLLLVPWTVRNQIRFGEFVTVSTNSEEVLFYANCEDVYHGESMGFWSFACQERVREERIAAGRSPDPPGNEAQRARAWGEMGRRYALDHRDRLPAVAAARVARAWDLAYSDHNIRALVIEGRPKPWAEAGLWIYRIVGVAGVVGVVLLRRRGRIVWPLIATVAMVTVIAVYAYGHVRFRTAGDLVLIVGAAVTLDTILPGRRDAHP